MLLLIACKFCWGSIFPFDLAFDISAKTSDKCTSFESQLEYWEELLLKLNEFKRYRCIVGSISESCLKPAGPLLASAKEAACLAALDIVEVLLAESIVD